MIRYLIAFAAAASLFAAASATASAAPDRPVVTTDCGADGSFEVIINNGRFGAVRDTTNGRIFVPVAFANVSGTFTDSEGTVFPFEEEDMSRPAPPKADLLHCTFELTDTEDGGTVEVSGEVTGFIAGRRP